MEGEQQEDSPHLGWSKKYAEQENFLPNMYKTINYMGNNGNDITQQTVSVIMKA